MMGAEEMAEAVLARCMEGAFQKEACQAVAEEVGVSWKSVLAAYTKLIPKEQRPINGGAGAARRKAERVRREKREAVVVKTACAGIGCEWEYTGTVKDGRTAYATHAAECTAERPKVVKPAPGSLAPRGAMVPGAALALA
jgi:hypothetical protein